MSTRQARMDVLRILLLIAVLAILSRYDWPCLASPTTEYPTKKLGVRSIAARGKQYKIPWYRVRADYNSIKTADFWKKLRSPQGTKTAYVGQYGKIRWCEWFDGETHAQRCAQGVDFLGDSRFRVDPGPGRVYLRRWLFDEQRRDEGMVFNDRRYYVFCLDSQPAEQWRTVDKRPGCDLDGELEHVIGIIEVQPTFELDERSSSPILHVTRESLLAFRSERHYAFPESAYEQEFAVVRAEDGTFRFESKGKKSAAAKLETVQKLLYAVNTCKWAKHGKPHVFEVSPPVTRTVLVYRDKQHQARKVTICYDMGGWYMDDFDSGHYSTVYPHLLFEVQDDIRELCQAATRTTKE